MSAGWLGYNSRGAAITDSYWNTDIFGAGAAGEGRTTAQLQSPTGYTGIYRDWNADLDNADGDDDDATGADDFWDFGTSSQYPALKVDFDGDGAATAAEFGGQHGDPPAPTPLVFIEGANGEYDVDGDRLIEISNLEQLNAVRYDLFGRQRPARRQRRRPCLPRRLPHVRRGVGLRPGLPGLRTDQVAGLQQPGQLLRRGGRPRVERGRRVAAHQRQ